MKQNKFKFLMSLVMLLFALSASAYNFMVDGIAYDINGNEATVTYTDNSNYSSNYSGLSGELVIPVSVTYNGEIYSVTTIGEYAFYGCTSLTSVSIPNSITTIDWGAFADCSGLTSVTIPNSVTSIGNSAFEGCSRLTNIDIPNSVTTIGWGAFNNTAWYNNQPTGLVYAGMVAYKYKGNISFDTDITIREGTSGIASSAFAYCNGLTSVTIPNSVITIGLQAFYCCKDLTNLTIGNSVKSIGEGAFRETGLTTFDIPNSVTYIGPGAFNSTPWYNNQPNGLIYVGNVALKYKGEMPQGTCIALKDSTLGIGSCAFENCVGLSSIDIPNTVIAIGDYAFDSCTGLNSIEIPNSVTSIGREAFAGCSGLTNLTISNSVTDIDIQTFLNCYSLESLTIPNSVTSIGLSAFKGCSGLTSVTIPNSVTKIEEEAFSGCTDITSITIPESVGSIGNYAFANCLSITELIYNAKSCCYDDWYNKHPFRSTNIQNITIGDNVKIIPDGFAYFFTDISTISIPNSVTSIGNYSFASCSSLMSIKIPNSVIRIGNRAFGECIGLKCVNIPNSVSHIGEAAFLSCNNLESITLPTNLTVISKSLLAGCNRLASIIIPNSVADIGEYAFSGCSKLTSIEFPNSITSIGNSAFQNCRGLTSIEIPRSVTSIGSGAFAYCSNLQNIEIPNSVNFIGSDPFYACSNIVNLMITGEGEWKGGALFENSRRISHLIIDSRITSVKGMKVYPYSVYSYSMIPPTCDENSFIDYSGTLHVPASSLAAYFTADYWCNFANVVGDAVELDEVIISQDSVEVNLGNLFNLTATLAPTNATFNDDISWQFNSDVVRIIDGYDNSYTFEAVGVGECDIIVRCLNKKAICHVVVNDTTVTITLDQQEAMVLPNHIITLTPIPNPIIPELTVTSSDPSVAAARLVNNRIQVVGIKEGTTTITVGSVDGTAIPATCLVTVYTEPGDMNCDGFVNISDVTSLIDYLLSGDDSQISTKNADVNGDESINISDVTILIDILLSGN